MSTQKVRKGGKFVKYIKLPLKLLARVRDLYVHSLTGCAGHVVYGNAVMGCPAPFPRSFSVSSASSRDDDLRELMRIASARKLETVASMKAGAAAMTRSRTIVIGRIDEDRPCEFGGFGIGNDVVLRSRSYAASRTGLV